jgi:quercetin dioxygenase-like cupin family protein
MSALTTNKKAENAWDYSSPALWRDSPAAWHEIMPGVKRRILAHTRTGMAVLYNIAPNKVFPLHEHPHAQFGIVLEGGGTFKLKDKVWKLKKVDTYFIPPGIKHELTTDPDVPSVYIDFFTPEREDYLPESKRPDE